MTDTIITMEQILALSDLNKFFQFIYLNIYWVCGVILLIVIFSEFLDKLIIKTLEKLTFKPKIIMILFYLLVFPCVLSIATYVDRTTLNENQIKLIKSINNSQFQADVLNSVEEHGAYVFAIKQPIKLLADSSYQQVTNVKPHKITKRYDPYQEKLDSIEFYKSVNP